jgi:tetratricopeptide (TPR) repeat protein
MKWIFVLFICSGLNFHIKAQDVNIYIKEAERLEVVPDEKAAFNKFKEALKFSPQNINVLIKCSELCSRIGNREANPKNRDAYYNAALLYGKKALAINPGNDEANVALAMAIGRSVLVKSGNEKISAVKDIRRYAENALKINPQNFKAWHVLGKWHYEVSNLNFVEKAAIKVMYGGLPDASFKKAILAYEKVKLLKPSFMLNYLELAKAYKKNDERQMAIAQLKYLVKLPLQTEDDPRIKSEAQNLIKTWEN